MMLVILCTLVTATLAAPAPQSMNVNDDGSYQFFYETGEDGGHHSRSEVRHPDGVVVGKFSYQDPDGEMREVNYRADDSGYVAQGDVGVPGAPKGQFPVIEDQPQQSSERISATAEAQSTEPSNISAQNQPQEDVNHHADSHQSDEDKDDMQNLALEESAALDDPPEGFPPGYFLQEFQGLRKFQGLRRLPEPTKKEKPTTTEAPKTSPPPKATENAVLEDNEERQPETSFEVKAGDPSYFAPSHNPFQGLSPHEWASSMYHQPVYVFSYKQPDSYGYHYFF